MAQIIRSRNCINFFLKNLVHFDRYNFLIHPMSVCVSVCVDIKIVR